MSIEMMTSKYVLQWGRLVIEAERTGLRLGQIAASELQWGRLVIEAESGEEG